ncbi:uncharacterized protein LOC134269943 [Saccostrea cucullata]|uniref:uncharacterized protein LOC134269943 n=1 Tax=Saccostrea cuccullata TaxID=36930 RepID=UPI002ED53C00
MSILNYFKTLTTPSKKQGICLPDPQHTPEKRTLIENLNDIVDEEYQKTPESGKKRKRGSYQHYTPEQKAKMGRYAIDNGPAKAAKYFSEKLGVKINESSIRTIRQQYLLRQKLSTEPVKEVVPKKRGRPKLLGDELEKLFVII